MTGGEGLQGAARGYLVRLQVADEVPVYVGRQLRRLVQQLLHVVLPEDAVAAVVRRLQREQRVRPCHVVHSDAGCAGRCLHVCSGLQLRHGDQTNAAAGRGGSGIDAGDGRLREGGEGEGA